MKYSPIIARLDTLIALLESRSCSPASPAPSDGSSAASGGTDGPKAGTGSGTGTVPPTSTPCHTSDAEPVKLSANQFCAVCHGRGTVGGEECDCVYAVDGQSSDPSAAVRDDPKRPGWLEDEMLPLPPGTERVRRHKFKGGYTIGAFPSQKIWWDIPLEWSETRQVTEENRPNWQDAEVYRVPAPAKDADRPKTKHEALYDAARRFVLSSRFEPDSTIQQDLAEAVRQLTPLRDDPIHDTHARPKIEHQAPSSPEIEQERGEVFNPNPQPATVGISPEKPTRVVILPPLEIADHAEALGWTEGSEVWKSNRHGCFRVYPSARILWPDGNVEDSSETPDRLRKWGDTLLPNRRVPVEGEKYSDIHDLHTTGLARNIVAASPACPSCGQPGWRNIAGTFCCGNDKCSRRHFASPRPAKSAGEVAEDWYTQWVQYRDSFRHAPKRPVERDLFNGFVTHVVLGGGDAR